MPGSHGLLRVAENTNSKSLTTSAFCQYLAYVFCYMWNQRLLERS